MANLSIHIVVLEGAAISAGIVANMETRERSRVSTLTTAAVGRERYIRSVVESLREGLIGLDPEGRITTWNAAMERWSGV